MNSNYHFSDIVGTAYWNGPIIFAPDDSTVFCPNRNLIKSIDVKRNLSNTLDFDFTSNITNFCINFAGTHACIATAHHCFYVNLCNSLILHHFNVVDNVKVMKFSPNGRYVAFGVAGVVIVYSIASTSKLLFNPFLLVNKFEHSSEQIISIDWSSDGRLIAAGGANRTVKVFAAEKGQSCNVGVYVMSERAPLVDAWFTNEKGYDLLCVDKSGTATLWMPSHTPDQIILKKRKQQDEAIEGEEVQPERLSFTKIKRINLCHHLSESFQVELTASSFNSKAGIFVAAFSHGSFGIFKLSDMELLQLFSVGQQRIEVVVLNKNGTWLALGCGEGTEAQLLVWEWQSESFILRQQSHSQAILSAAYSPDGSLIATGGEDGKVKIWSCKTSFCIITFTEHENAVSDICFTQSGKAILSASFQGSIRAHDMKRYRNFRTLVAPNQTQLSLLCTDQSGDIVMAASRGDRFDIYIWGLETGQLLDVLGGHTSLITGLCCLNNTLCTVSLDKTLRMWNILEGACLETIRLLDEGLDVKFSPTGSSIAALCYDSCINLFDSRNSQQIGTIETKLDIDAGRLKKDKIRKKTSEKNKSFTCISFSPDGQFILAGGQSNNFCLYSVQFRVKLRQFKLSINHSLDGVMYEVDYRKLTEFGNIDLFDLTDSEEEERNFGNKIKLPGTKKTDHSERAMKPVISISNLAFNPAGQEFAVVSTEGVSLYRLDKHRHFNPFQLELKATPNLARHLSKLGDHSRALSMALKLNEDSLTKEILQSIPLEQLGIVVRALGFVHAKRLLAWIFRENLGPTPDIHFHFYLLIAKEFLQEYGAQLRNSLDQDRPLLTAIQQMLLNQQNILAKMCSQNKDSVEYLLMARRMSEAATSEKDS